MRRAATQRSGHSNGIGGKVGSACLLAVASLIGGVDPAAAAAPAAYVSDAAQSRLEFSGIQAGAEFRAQFKSFTTAVALAPDNVAAAHIEVQITLNSLDSMDADRDKTMRGPEFFDVAHSPVARYTTTSITKTASGYAALGTLTLRGVSKPVPITFQFVPAASGAKLEGDAKVQRLDFGVGTGEWKSTEWVGNEVKVHFSLALRPQP
jgi:polyisoprenoid-binding protein YceI